MCAKAKRGRHRKEWALGSQLLILPEPHAEASCRSQIVTAQAVELDMGKETATVKGVSRWAKCSLQNSERDVSSTIKKQGTVLPVDVGALELRGQIIPWIDPRTWLEFLVTRGLWPHLAGCTRYQEDLAENRWRKFWANYRVLNPGFSLFEDESINWSRTAAMILHGDEGRALKHSALMCTAFQSALGRGYGEKRACNREDHSLRVNFQGHTFTNRFILSVMPKTCYESDPETFHEIMGCVAESLSSLVHQGVTDPTTGKLRHVVCIGCKGDAPYLAKVGRFYRSFNTQIKRGAERGPPKGVCHQCLAGTSGVPAEDICSMRPGWLQTMGVKLPWTRTPFLVQHLHHDPADPSTFFQNDLWHVFHLGVGKSFCASTIQLCLEVVPGRNLDEKWSFLTESYLGWCRGAKRQAHVNKVSDYLMSYGDKTGAVGQWSKGALTANLMLWMGVLLAQLPADGAGRLRRCLGAVKGVNTFFSFLFRSQVFLTQAESLYLAGLGFRFLKTYGELAMEMYRAGRPWLYPLYPKLHIYHHALVKLKVDAEEKSKAINPLVWSCQMDEDIVGRASRLSRRVSIRTVMKRTFERYLVQAYEAFQKAELLL